MTYIALIAVSSIMILHATGAIPQDSVGGSMVIAPVFLAAALAVGIHEAWTKRRGLLGWIVNIAVSFVGAFLIIPPSGMVVILILSLFVDFRGSVAATGGPAASVTYAGVMVVSLLGVWGALQIVNRWR